MKISKFLPVLLKLTIASSRLTFVSGEEDDFPNEITKISSGSCLTAGLCCKGKDSSCVIQHATLNSIIELHDMPCYCDAGCILLNDCCSDYRFACGVQDCLVSEWGNWSPCSTECGLGTMNRTREITIEPRNGGKPCPPMKQTRGCRGTNCRHHRNRITLEDTAVILPIEYSEKRKMNSNGDFAKHIRLRQPKHLEKENASPYCVEFQVIRSTLACKSLESFITLREGASICVLCEKQAQKSYAGYRCAGSGTRNGISTRFSSLREPACHGKWQHVSLNPNCACEEGPKFIFI